ncbi:MAG: Nif3-like dinuclear metal center hexameric protein [Gammaproteobacteria bacterium]|nr:MAG: Nif3-like dinuclear metal center hexameric protein [Gammaproteobacteria bacterium]
MALRDSIDQALKELLQPQFFKDYAPNGLQVEGKADIHRVVSGVTASQALIDQAIESGADALLVHHGYFWKGENPALVGMKYRRIKALIANDINLFAYHLPLDAHPQLGNNVQLAKKLGIEITGPLELGNDRSIGNVGLLSQACSGEQFSRHIAHCLAREPLHIAGSDRPIQRVAWCTGGAQGYIELAIDQGVDAFITGEVSEQTTHLAREHGIHFFAAGHHATERYGAAAVGAWLAEKFKINHQFIDIDNPV